jgi:hypothetical protein
MSVLEDKSFLGMVLRILLRQIDLGSSHGCHEEYYPCNNFPCCYILDNGDSYSRLPSDIDQVVRLFCPDMLVLVLLLILIDYFNGCTRARSLSIAAQIKIMEEPPWYL